MCEQCVQGPWQFCIYSNVFMIVVSRDIIQKHGESCRVAYSKNDIGNVTSHFIKNFEQLVPHVLQRSIISASYEILVEFSSTTNLKHRGSHPSVCSGKPTKGRLVPKPRELGIVDIGNLFTLLGHTHK